MAEIANMFKINIASTMLDRTIEFLEENVAIKVTNKREELVCPTKIKLKENTAIVGINGEKLNAMVAFGYDDLLLDKIAETFLLGEPLTEAD